MGRRFPAGLPCAGETGACRTRVRSRASLQPLMLREEVLGASHTPPPPHTSSLNDLISSPPWLCARLRKVSVTFSPGEPSKAVALGATLCFAPTRSTVCTFPWRRSANKLSVPGTIVPAVRLANCARRAGFARAVACTQQKNCTDAAQILYWWCRKTFQVFRGAGVLLQKHPCVTPPEGGIYEDYGDHWCGQALVVL